jgi:hypothetical protein
VAGEQRWHAIGAVEGAVHHLGPRG